MKKSNKTLYEYSSVYIYIYISSTETIKASDGVSTTSNLIVSFFLKGQWEGVIFFKKLFKKPLSKFDSIR